MSMQIEEELGAAGCGEVEAYIIGFTAFLVGVIMAVVVIG